MYIWCAYIVYYFIYIRYAIYAYTSMLCIYVLYRLYFNYIFYLPRFIYTQQIYIEYMHIHIYIHTQVLDVSSNYITVFPESLLGLRALSELSFCGNMLAYLPSEVNKLNRLTSLDLSRYVYEYCVFMIAVYICLGRSIYIYVYYSIPL